MANGSIVKDSPAAPSPAPSPVPQPSPSSLTHVDYALAAAVIGFFEGFQPTARWDVNAWRLGFGSDTEGPAQTPVKRGMATTRERALQNLAARLPQFVEVIIQDIGAPAWARLKPNAQAALLSLCYNYGELPDYASGSVRNAAAAAVLDIPKLVTMIELRANDNGGINAKRRFAEAALVASTETT